MNIKGLKSLLLPLLVMALLAGGWIGLAIYQANRLSLPDHVKTLAAFDAAMPKPEKVIVFEKDGSSYIEVIGRLPNFPAVPSGPPAYICDSTGVVSYWTIDTGDAREYWEKWQNRTNSREVPMREALEFVKSVKR